MGRQSLPALPGHDDVRRPDEEEDSIRIIHRALDAGINFSIPPTSTMAARASAIVGTALRDRRDQVVLATKVRGAWAKVPTTAARAAWRPARGGSEPAAARHRLIDLYFIHSPDYTTPLEESLGALDDCVRPGKSALHRLLQLLRLAGLRGPLEQRPPPGAVRARAAAVQPGEPRRRAGAAAVLPEARPGRRGLQPAGPRRPLRQSTGPARRRPRAPAPRAATAASSRPSCATRASRSPSAPAPGGAARLHADAIGPRLGPGQPDHQLRIIGPRTLEQLEDNLGASSAPHARRRSRRRRLRPAWRAQRQRLPRSALPRTRPSDRSV